MGIKESFFRYGGVGIQDPFQQLSYSISALLSDGIHGASHLLKRYPTKTCGALSLVANSALTYEGVKTMNPYLLSASLPSIGSDLTLVIYGDPIARAGETDPQEKPFSWKDVTDAKNHPNEVSNTLEGIAGFPLMMYGMGDANNPNPGIMLNGMADMVANFAVVRIRQKKESTATFEHKILNAPIIKPIANKIETDPPFASSFISLSALCSVGAYEMAQGRGLVQGETDTSFLVFSGMGIASELINMFFVDKRRITITNTLESQADALPSADHVIPEETPEKTENTHAL